MPGHEDLALIEVNNVAASSVWSEQGLLVDESHIPFIQIYPALNPETGLLCGIKYYIKIINTATNTEIESARGYFLCECATNIYPNHTQTLSQLGRWHSSAHGIADTRITDSTADHVLPVIKARSSGAIITVFEDRESAPRIRGATFRKSEPVEFFGTGTKSWFNYDFSADGKQPAITTDLYDRLLIAYEMSVPTTDGDLPRNSIFAKACKFADEIPTTEIAKCDKSQLTANIVTRDEFISASIIKRVLVKPNNATYYTYNAAGQITAIVSTCQIVLQVWGTPETVAYRFKNETDTAYSSWYAATPEISDYMTEINWTLSKYSGIKEICVQAMTYSGITTEYCIPIIGDYASPNYSVYFYFDDQYSESLPVLNEMYVAATKFDTSTGESVVNATIYIEIIPDKTVEFGDQQHKVTFDVLQQGNSDAYDLATTEHFVDGRQVFRGKFTIYKENNVLNIDGLARIRVNFPENCAGESTLVSGPLVKDSLNIVNVNSASEEDEHKTLLDAYRQDISGRIGVDILIRPTEDPYFIFGNPDIFLKES
jgi:hypothetical protein